MKRKKASTATMNMEVLQNKFCHGHSGPGPMQVPSSDLGTWQMYLYSRDLHLEIDPKSATRHGRLQHVPGISRGFPRLGGETCRDVMKPSVSTTRQNILEEENGMSVWSKFFQNFPMAQSCNRRRCRWLLVGRPVELLVEAPPFKIAYGSGWVAGDWGRARARGSGTLNAGWDCRRARGLDDLAAFHGRVSTPDEWGSLGVPRSRREWLRLDDDKQTNRVSLFLTLVQPLAHTPKRHAAFMGYSSLGTSQWLKGPEVAAETGRDTSHNCTVGSSKGQASTILDGNARRSSVMADRNVLEDHMGGIPTQRLIVKLRAGA
ncbi:hypothetical protein V8F20_005789 [Naviculisporaceae sp. PSN 640]